MPAAMPVMLAFGHAAVVEPRGVLVLEGVEEAVADVAGKDDDAVVLGGQFGDRGGEGVSHASPNSFRAA